MDALVTPLLGLQELSNNLLATAISDLTDAEAKARSRDGTDYPSLTELAASFAALHGDLRNALGAAGDRLMAPVAGRGPHGEARTLDRLLFLTWHEAYHIGGIGAIRREQHRKGIAELVAAS